MKFRKGFVTNSSSTSFVCDFRDCDREYEGYDSDCYGLDGAMFGQCENMHNFCIDHMPSKDIEAVEKYFDWSWVPEKYCPVCQDEWIDELLESKKILNKINEMIKKGTVVFDEDTKLLRYK